MTIPLFSTDIDKGEDDLIQARNQLISEIDCFGSNPSFGHNIIAYMCASCETGQYTYACEQNLANVFSDLFKDYNIADITIENEDICIIGTNNVYGAKRLVRARQLTHTGQEYFDQLTDDLRIPKDGITVKGSLADGARVHRFCPGDEETFLKFLYDTCTEDLEWAFRSDEQYIYPSLTEMAQEIEYDLEGLTL